VARWYRAVGSYFIFHRLFADARDHFEEAADVVPDDPDVLYDARVCRRFSAHPRIQDYVRIARQTGVSILDVTIRDRISGAPKACCVRHGRAAGLS
jgi:hypothetical protein